MPTFADRDKIALGAKEQNDIEPSVRHMLNSGDEGSCRGGSVDVPRQWLIRTSVTSPCITHDTRQSSMARSSKSKKDFSPSADCEICRS